VASAARELVSERLPAIAAATAAATTTTTATAAVVTTTTVATAAAAFTATTVAAATTTVATATAATTAEATAAAAARLTLLGFIDAKRPTVEGLAVHAFDRLGRFFVRPHGDKREATRAASFTVRHEVDVAHSAELRKCSADAFSRGVKRKISNVQTSVHRLLEPAQ
jgi:hypothetical protein